MNKNPLPVIEKLIDHITFYYNNNHIVPRGTLYPLDPLFAGNLYTMFQYGSGYDTLMYSGNVSTLTEAVEANFSEISVAVVLPDVQVGSMLRIGNDYDMVVVKSIDEEDLVITTTKGSFSHVAGDTVTLFGRQCFVESDTDITSSLAIKNRVVFRINKPILVGSSISVVLSPDYQRQATYVIESIEDYYTDGDDYVYDVRLDSNLLDSLTYGDYVYFVEYPYYISDDISIPTHYATNSEIGPFLLDYVSVNMQDKVIDTDYTVTLYDISDNVLFHGSMGTNYPVYYRDIPSSTFVFSDVLMGRVSYTQDKEFVGIIEGDGEFRCYTELAPRVMLPSGISWSFDIVTQGNVNFFVELDEDVFHYDTYLLSGSNFTVTVTPDSIKETKGILMGIKGDEGSYFKMTNWRVNTNVSKVKYSVLSKNLEPSLWLGSGLILKPLFPVLDDIKFVYGKTLFNNGKVYI